MGQKQVLETLGPFGLTKCLIYSYISVQSNTYTIKLVGMQSPFQGPISPPCAVNPTFLKSLNLQETCTHFTWAYPLDIINHIKEELPKSVPPGMALTLNGGFLFLNQISSDDYEVVTAYAINITGKELTFSEPIQFNDERKMEQLDGESNRLQPVTLQFLKDKQIQKFCWINPGEYLGDTLISNGAFLYKHKEANFYFKLLEPKVPEKVDT